jgi:hypothetical protein
MNPLPIEFRARPPPTQEPPSPTRSEAAEETAVTSICRSLGIVAGLLALGCASSTGSWEAARSQDTPGAYHRFLRDNPNAPQAQEASERLAFTRLRQKPTAEGYAKFRVRYPQSELLAEIRPVVEQRVFEQTRVRGTGEAFAEFLREFPDGQNAERAAGNAEYLENRGYGGSVQALAAFAARHPASDFASEAERSAASIDARRGSAVRRVGLVIEVSSATPARDRVARRFAERASRYYARTALELVPLRNASEAAGARVDAVLSIRHREELVGAKVGADQITTPGALASTDVSLTRLGDSQPISSEEFRFKVSVSERRDGESLVFGSTGVRYWKEFFFPVATWNTQQAVRAPYPVAGPGVAVELVDHRAVVLFASGSFQVVDLSNPAAPQVVGQYRRPQDLSTWNGVRAIDGRFAIYGEGGLEIIDFASGTPQRVLALDRAKVGSVVAVAKADSGLLIAGSRGLTLLAGGTVQPLIEMSVLGAAMLGDRVVFTSGTSLFVASLASLRKQQADAELPLGKQFAPWRIRASGNTAIVFGEEDVVFVDVSNPRKPRIQSRMRERAVGEISDALAVGGRFFVLGERGLLVTDASGERIDGSVDVSPRTHLGASGRHLVMIGDASLQVVDATPFVASGSVAAPRP